MSADSDVLAALLRQEHAAIYAFGVIGARLDEHPQGVLQRADEVRREHRDALADAVRRLGGTPPDPQPAYALVGSVDGTAAALATARLYSDTLQSRALEAVPALTDRPARALVARILVDEATYRTRLDVNVDRDIGTRPASAIKAFPGRRS